MKTLLHAHFGPKQLLLLKKGKKSLTQFTIQYQNQFGIFAALVELYHYHGKLLSLCQSGVSKAVLQVKDSCSHRYAGWSQLSTSLAPQSPTFSVFQIFFLAQLQLFTACLGSPSCVPIADLHTETGTCPKITLETLVNPSAAGDQS